mgnify:CR=1 FL=1|tara:strand:+ start:48 stop:494 length:447 start_codon:yes stop_codon:yes gene_type:complete
MMDKKTIYVAGPMRGYPNWNYDSFNAAEKVLSTLGWRVINPANLDANYEETADLDSTPESFDPNDSNKDHEVIRKIMKRDCDVICDECDAIYLLTGWEKSKGALCEKWLCECLGVDVYYESGENCARDRDPKGCQSVSVGGKIPTRVD